LWLPRLCGIDRRAACVSCAAPFAWKNRPVNTANAALEDPQIQKAMTALREGRPQAAEQILRKHLETDPDNVTAMTMLAETLLRFDRHQEAEKLLTRSLEIAPDFIAARHTIVSVMLMLNKRDDAFAHADRLIAQEPANPNHHGLKAMAHAWVGDHAGAASEYEIVLRYIPKAPGPWLAYAHSLRTLNRRDEAIAAYRKVIERFPRIGEPYWALANLKSFRFEDSEIEAMRAQLATTDLPVESRIQIGFALGKALEDKADYAAAFERYKEGNALKRATLSYNAEMTSVYVQNCKTLFTPKYFAEFKGAGSERRDPIFVVGLPRSGSTLIEQILASHSQIEGTMELRVLPFLVGRIGAKGTMQYRAGQSHPALATDSQAPYPECLRNLFADDLKLLGEEYLERAHIHRVEGKPFFIDKMPDNFAHIGLIHLMLPNAKIIDARRDPMACCFSAFKHYFPLGKDFSYSLSDLGRYYSDYVQLMAHWDRALPGKIHRVHYEHVVEDSEREIRRLFDYLELPFEERALRFHETERAVRTASADQVRRPIFKEGLDDWRHFEEWLTPLKSALGPTLAAYADELKADR
jgi:tetratricopeptide (TPR) repeat protein